MSILSSLGPSALNPPMWAAATADDYLAKMGVVPAYVSTVMRQSNERRSVAHQKYNLNQNWVMYILMGCQKYLMEPYERCDSDSKIWMINISLSRGRIIQ